MIKTVEARQKKPSLDVVIVNWNAGPLLEKCVRALHQTDQENFSMNRVTVVDNASSDGSLALLDRSEMCLTLIENKENLGFARACNQGAAGTRADYILFLNPDVLLSPQSLDKPLVFLQQQEQAKIGICGIQLKDETGRIWRSCRYFPTLKKIYNRILGLEYLFPQRVSTHAMLQWDHQSDRVVDQVIGAFFLVRRTVFDQLHGFCERFFVYFEEVDFSLRATKEGWLSYFLSSTSAFHLGGVTSRRAGARRLFYESRSRVQYAYKHFGRLRALLVLLATLLLEPVTRAVLALSRFSWKDCLTTLKGSWMLWMSIPTVLRVNRRRTQ